MKLKIYTTSLLIVFFLSLSIVNSQKLVVGVSPSSLNLGELSPGESKIVSFYVITPSDDDILVDLDADDYDISIFRSGRSPNMMLEFSEEKSSHWVDFLNNPVLLKPGIEKLETSISSVKAFREVRFILKIPEDAEPGYRSVKIKPSPRLPKTPNRGAVAIQTVTPIILNFRVIGEAERKMKILDLTPGNMVGNRLELNIHVLNEGTVTTTCQAETIKIYNDTDGLVHITSSGFHDLGPGEIGQLKAYWDNPDLDSDIYSASVDLNYFTGRDFKEIEFSYDGIPTGEVVKSISKSEEKSSPNLIFIILIIIIIISYLIYRWVK